MATAVQKRDEKHRLREIRGLINRALQSDGIVILPPADVQQIVLLMQSLDFAIDATILDPWYNKGIGGMRSEYLEFFLDVIKDVATFSSHVFFWGFPEIVAPFVERIPQPLTLICWLTWYYKNNPSVIRGWRSSQNACLHLARPDAPLFPERFLNEKQKDLAKRGKLRYMPGPTSVIETGPQDVIEQSLLVGFVGKNEQTGHPAQKPERVFEQLVLMSIPNQGIVFDPMAGSGTAGAVARTHGFKAILCDSSPEYIEMMERRLGVLRLPIF